MSDPVRAVLLGVLVLASCIWVGGYVAIAVVARVATRTLTAAQRIAFFRALGRRYLLLGVSALLVAFGTGAALLTDHPWDGFVTAALVTGAALVTALVVGVAQARRMTRLRAAALATAEGRHATDRVRRGARSAALLRAVIGLLSLALIALGSLLAT